MLRIGLDTSCLNARKNHPVLNKLNEFYQKGFITLITSTVNEKEQTDTNKNVHFKSQYLISINQKEKVFEVGWYDFADYGNAVYGSKDVHKNLKAIFGTDKNNHYDLWLIETCLSSNCDYFLTLNSRHFIDNGKKEAFEKLGIKAREPNDNFLAEIQPYIQDDGR